MDNQGAFLMAETRVQLYAEVHRRRRTRPLRKSHEQKHVWSAECHPLGAKTQMWGDTTNKRRGLVRQIAECYHGLETIYLVEVVNVWMR